MTTSLHVSQPLSGTAELGIKARLLQAERARNLWRLRFRDQLEHEFRGYVAQSSRGMRLGIFLTVLFFLLITPLYGGQILSASPALLTWMRPLVYGQLPIVIAGIVVIWFRPLSRYATWLCVAMCMVGTASVLAQRSLAAAWGYDIPIEYTGVFALVLLILLRVPFWQALPWIVLAAVAMVANEWLVVRTDPAGYFHIVETLILISVSCVGGYSHEYFIRQAWLNNCLLSLLSRRDSLTGLLNRQALQSTTRHMIAHAYRERCAFAISMIDIDYFKQYNDTYGHPAGDAVIHRIAGLLRNSARRPHDFCGRYGGEEFTVAWIDGDYDDLCALAHNLCTRVQQTAIPHAASPVCDSVTISIGVYWVGPEQIANWVRRPDHASADDVSLLFEYADKMLYKAKNAGRNQVACTRACDDGNVTATVVR